jgi:glutaredoxin
MSHYFEKTIVDAKDIYTDYLLNIISPLLYHGLKSVYDRATAEEKKYAEGEKIDPSIKNPGVIVLFQYFLRELEIMNDEMIEQETGRFRDSSGCADIFDDLIKAVIKSHIIVLTFNASGKSCKVVKDKLHEKVEPKSFIHKCYLECSRIFFDHPRLFFHEFPINERKDNERIIYQLVKVGIKNGIKRCLPMKAILEEYLKHDYLESTDDDPNVEYMKVKDLLKEFEKDYIEVNCDEFLDNKEEFLKTIQSYTKKPYKTFPMVFDKETFVGGFIETIKYLDTDN